ncbi:hypothetical protein QAD02_020260 [Eretmocerus hayati]|uniref:Uncharacterized protein n=1 Tax=Eretmocerus hayati TaxID=131215 RepID=A0ACC2PMY6_9HYME|nr:hypothetical protein QAD02_020260 [Eretmocerus hayati]
MTLYWWMHWFWVTAQIAVSMTRPASEDYSRSIGTSVTNASLGSSSLESLARLQQNYRMAKAIGVELLESHGAPDAALLRSTLVPRSLQIVTAASDAEVPSDTSEEPKLAVAPDSPPGRTERNKSSTIGYEAPARVAPLPPKKEPKMTWIQTFSKPPRPKLEQDKDKTSSPDPTTVSAATTGISTTTAIPSPEATLSPEELTVMPLQTPRPRVEPNAIHREQQQISRSPASSSSVLRGPGASGELLLGENQIEMNAEGPLASPASVLDGGMGDTSRLGRARGAFSNEFQREQILLDGKRVENDRESNVIQISGNGVNVTEIATITGGCLAVIVLLSTVGSLGFMMYRRKYLNPPQTLNSDKCSNPDSSGYIDDSTIRDNSEEMYSLDNDSFLNSLEAMTIQNYWTDSVKHTKL